MVSQIRVDVLVARLRPAPKKCGRLHDHACLAVTALGYILRNPCFLARVLAAGRKPFDRDVMFPFRCGERNLTRPDRLAIIMNGTRTADSHPATVFGSGQTQQIAQCPEKGHL